MAPCTAEWITLCSNIILCATALRSSYKLFRDHRAPSVGLWLVGVSAGLCILCPSDSCLAALQRDLKRTSEFLAPTLLSFDFLWLSEDHNTALVLLCGSCLLLALSDSLSAETLAFLTHCLGLSSLSCCLTVCLFAGNALGALCGLALSLPLLWAPGFTVDALSAVVSPAGAEAAAKWVMNVLVSAGCWISTPALHKFALDLMDRSNFS